MRLLTPLALALSMAGLLAGCASTGIDSDDPHAPMHEGRSPAQMSGATSSAEMDAAPGKSETVRGDGKPDWAAVYETPPGTRYREQQLIYVDRHSLREHKLDKLTYFTAEYAPWLWSSPPLVASADSSIHRPSSETPKGISSAMSST